MRALRPAVLSLLAVSVLMAAPAMARRIGPVGVVEIVDWGVTDWRIVGRHPSPGSASGYALTLDPTDPARIRHTDRVEACLGTQFGVQFRLRAPDEGGPAVPVLPLAVEWSHPPLQPPGGPVVTLQRFSGLAQSDPRFSGWIFEQPYELVPGTWTVTLKVGDEVVARKAFEVELAADCTAPTS